MGRRIVWFDFGRCWGCGNCVARCAELHDGKPVCWVVNADSLPVPLRCFHCSDAVCMFVCPVNAIVRRGDAVVIEHEKCRGCGFCYLACPFGAIDFDVSVRKPMKCDLCIDIVEGGGAPVCVEACPTHALQFVELDELLAKTAVRGGYAMKYMSTMDPQDLIELYYTPSPNEEVE